MPRGRHASPSRALGLILPHELIERLDRFALELGERTPGVIFTRNDAVRVLLLRELAASDAEDADNTKRGR